MAEEKTRPNIVLFVPDEMRGDTVSLGGKNNSVIKTPNIDRVAREGVAFTNCFTSNPVCAPSRIATFTGQPLHSSGHRSLYQLLEPHEENLFKLLKNAGYEVIWIGRNDLFTKKAIKESVTKRINMNISAVTSGNLEKMMKLNPYPEDHRLRKSFYFGERTEEQAQDIDYHIINSALEYLDSKHDKPFCLYIALNFPHPPYTVEEPYFSMYDREKIPKPIPSKLEDKPKFMRLMHEKYGLNKLTKDDFKEIVATYYGMISRVDSQFGQIIDKLKKTGAYDNTAIFFFADHGDYAGNYGLTEKWPNAFQECLIKIPLVMKIPGLEVKQPIFDDLVETIDIFPTILKIAGIETKYTHFGKALLPLIKGDLKHHKDAVFAEGGYDLREPQCFETPVKNPDIPMMGIYYDKTNIPEEYPDTVCRSVMIRTILWKMVLRTNGENELYDIQYDPNELNNLYEVQSYEKMKTKLKDQLLNWYLKTSDNPNWKKRRAL